MIDYQKRRTVEQMISHANHIRIMNPNMYTELVSLWKKFSQGHDGGQFEPWEPRTIREAYYKGWSDEDFVRALKGVGEPIEA